MMLTAGCGPDEHPDPVIVGLGFVGSTSAQQKDPEFQRFSLTAEILALAQIKNLAVQITVPKDVVIESYLLETMERDKTLFSERMTPDDPHSVVWQGEIHPRASRMQKSMNSYPMLRTSVTTFLKTPKSSLPLRDKFKVNVSLDYYDDPYASDEFVPYGSYRKSFEFGGERWK